MKNSRFFINFEDIYIPREPDLMKHGYSLSSHGDTLGELIENAVIAEVDEDGEEIDTYPLRGAERKIRERALVLIDCHVQNWQHRNVRFQPYDTVRESLEAGA